MAEETDIQTRQREAVDPASAGSPLLAKYGRAVVAGNEWKDATSYSQRGGETPNTWETRVGHCRLVVMRRKTGEWIAWTYSPETTRWILDIPTDCPEAAAQAATTAVIEWLRTLAAQIEANSHYPHQVSR